MQRIILITIIGYAFIHYAGLFLYPIPIVDLEVAIYGEFASALKYNILNIFNINEFFFQPHYEGSFIILAPFIAFFFFFFGQDLFTLNFSGIVFSTAFIITWLPLVKKIFKNIDTQYLALLFVFPLPLYHTNVLTVSHTMTHIGCLVWYGILLLYIDKTTKQEIKNSLKANIVIPTLIFTSYFYHPAMLPLLSGAYFFILYKFRLYSLPSLTLSLLLIFLSPTNKAVGERINITFQNLFDRLYDFINILKYLPGAQIPHRGDNNHTFFLDTLWVYLILLLTVASFRYFKLKRKDFFSFQNTNKSLVMAVAISTIFTVFSFLITDLSSEINTESYNGLRYLLLLTPAFFIMTLLIINNLPKNAQITTLCFIAFLNIIQNIAFHYPYKKNYVLSNHRGYIGSFPLYLKDFTPNSLFSAANAEVLIPWYGMRIFSSTQDERETAFNLLDEATPEKKYLFWIGLGVAQNMQSQYGKFYHGRDISKPNELSEKTHYQDILAHNCLLGNKQCPVPNDEEEQVIEAIKLGWLFSTPCTGFVDALKNLESSPVSAELLALSKIDLTDCPTQVDFEKINSIDLNLNSYHESITELFPLTSLTLRMPGNKNNIHYLIYGDWTVWTEFILHSPPYAP